MIEYTATINGLEKLQQNLAKAPGLVLSETVKATNQALATYQLGAREIVPKKTSQLANSITATPAKVEGTRVTGEVNATAPHAGFVEGGTGLYGPHRSRIYPTTKKALAFTAGGRKIVVASTRGMQGRFYMKGSLERHQADTDRAFAQAAENVARAIAEGGQ